MKMANEKRLIDANALQKRMFDYYDCVNEHTSKSTYTGETLMDYEVAVMIDGCIENAPTVDAVEVVRCEDCKRWNRYEPTSVSGRCGFLFRMRMDDDFCSYGERKDND